MVVADGTFSCDAAPLNRPLGPHWGLLGWAVIAKMV